MLTHSGGWFITTANASNIEMLSLILLAIASNASQSKYNVDSWSLVSEHFWSLRFQVRVIGSRSLKMSVIDPYEFYWTFKPGMEDTFPFKKEL